MNNKESTYTVQNDDLDPQLEAAVWAVLSEPLPADAIKRVKSQALILGNEQLRAIPLTQPIAFTKRRWFQLVSLAACVLLVVGVSTMLSPRDAFAQVVDNIRKLATAKFTIEFLGTNNLVATASVKTPDRMRLDFQAPGQTVNITNGKSGELISFDANSDQVSVNEIPKADSNFDILQMLQTREVHAVLSMDENTIAGTQLYEIFNGQGRVWVDSRTQLPKRIEMTQPTGSGITKLVYRDFEWDVLLDDSLFLMPLGKRVVRSSLLARPTEAELIAAFSIRQAFSQEPFEASFLDESNEPGLKLGRLAFDLSKDRAANFQIQVGKLQSNWEVVGISQAAAIDPSLVQKRIDYLCMKLDQWAGNVARTGGWVGTGVLPGESKVLCWWKDTNGIRILRGDLTIIDADQPPNNQ